MKESDDQNNKNYQNLEILEDETMNMLKEYAKGNPELVQDIVDSFAPEAKVLITSIEKAVSEENPDELQTSAHSLAGISGSIGANRLYQVARDVDNAIKTGQNQLAFNTAKHIKKHYEELVQLLDEF